MSCPQSPASPEVLLNVYQHQNLAQGLVLLEALYSSRLLAYFQRKLWGTCARLEQAPDLAHNTLIKLHGTLSLTPHPQTAAALEMLVFGTAKNIFLEARRNEIRHNRQELLAQDDTDPEPIDDGQEPLQGLMDQQLRTHLKHCMGLLPRRLNELLTLYSQGEPIANIAETMRYAHLSAVSRAKERAMKLVRDCLRAVGWEVGVGSSPGAGGQPWAQKTN